MTSNKTKMFVQTSQKDGKFKWNLQFEEFLSQTVHVADGLYFSHTPFLDFAGKGETPDQAYSNLLKIVSSFIFSLWVNNQLEKFAQDMGWEFGKQDDGGFVIITDTVKIKSASQPEQEVEITNPEILEAIEAHERGEGGGVLIKNIQEIKTPEELLNVLHTNREQGFRSFAGAC